ncbi:uncharacterized protein K460DRAFT_356122 [Cucurbitaria berberidis CBS 394.84]|uniref:Uncharacterized protein n=1 Tax=Cucurbitaria berberidis CBS 394.84 TaxID=1168544 RepID=A0A9P4GJT3_9PLEO|nr:uncharacterized protein K460DRAFT_356122 [Cucurbitaria berberidis CBS 394.84]KAF1846446.1 hypothetical protein K460DRAFT_356122 [Cucurbitaria berberidis CBS 394.84]
MSSLTYDTLRTSLVRSDANYAVNTRDDLSQSELTTIIRVRELIHIGVKMCDERFGRPEEIQTLIYQRTRDIESETSLFIPNGFEIDEEEKSPDITFVERLANGQVESSEDSRIFDGVDVGRIHVSTNWSPDTPSEHTSGVTTGGWGGECHQSARNSRPLPLNYTVDSDEEREKNWKTDSETSTNHLENNEDRETEEFNINASSRPGPEEPLTFYSVRLELQDALAHYEEACIDEASSLDYYEAQQAFKDGIELSKSPPKGLTPEQLWDDVEEKVLMSTYMGQRRQYVNNDDDGSLFPGGSVKPFKYGKMNNFGPLPDFHFGELRIGNVARADGKDEEHVVVPETPTNSSTRLKRKRDPICDSPNENSLTSTGSKRLRSNSHATLTVDIEAVPESHAPQCQQAIVTPLDKVLRGTEQASLPVNSEPQPFAPSISEFSPIKHAGVPISAAPGSMQAFYRTTVQSTLKELLNKTSSDEVKDLLNAYWEHIEREIPVAKRQQ